MNEKIIDAINMFKKIIQEDQKDLENCADGDWLFGVDFIHDSSGVHVKVHVHSSRFWKIIPDSCMVTKTKVDTNGTYLEVYDSENEIYYVTVIW